MYILAQEGHTSHSLEANNPLDKPPTLTLKSQFPHFQLASFPRASHPQQIILIGSLGEKDTALSTTKA